MYFRLSPRDIRILKIIDREPDGATDSHINSRVPYEDIEATKASLNFMSSLNLVEKKDNKFVLTSSGMKEIIKDRMAG